MEDLGPPPAFDLSELSVTEVDIAAEVAKELQNRSRSTGHDQDSAGIDEMIKRSKDLIAMFEKQVSKDSAASLPPQRPEASRVAMVSTSVSAAASPANCTINAGVGAGAGTDVDNSSSRVFGAGSNGADTKTAIKMSVSSVPSNASVASSKRSSTESTPHTPDAKIIASYIAQGQTVSPIRDQHLQAMTASSRDKPQNLPATVEDAQKTLSTSEIGTRRSGTTFGELNSINTGSGRQTPLPESYAAKVSASATTSQLLLGSGGPLKPASPSKIVSSSELLGSHTPRSQETLMHLSNLTTSKETQSPIVRSSVASSHLSLTSSMRTIPVGAASLPPVITVPQPKPVTVDADSHVLRSPPRFSDTDSDFLPRPSPESVQSDSMAPMSMGAPPPKPTAMIGIQPPGHKVPDLAHLNYDEVEDEETLVSVVRLQEDQQPSASATDGTTKSVVRSSSRLRIESMVLASSMQRSKGMAAGIGAPATEATARQLSIEERIDAQIESLEKSRQGTLLTRAELLSNITSGRSPPRSPYISQINQNSITTSIADIRGANLGRSTMSASVLDSVARTIDDTVEQLIKSSSRPINTPSRLPTVGGVAPDMSHSVIAINPQLAKSPLQTRSQSKLEPLAGVSTPMPPSGQGYSSPPDTLANSRGNVVFSTPNRKRPEPQKEKEQPVTRFYTAKELSTIQKLPQLMPTDQIRFMRVLQQVNGTTSVHGSGPRSGATGIGATSEFLPEITFEFVEGTGDLVVRVAQLVKTSTKKVYPPGTAFEGLVEDTYRVLIPAYLIPPRISLSNRHSQELQNWRQNKKAAEEQKHHSKAATHAKALLPSQKSLNWLVTFVDNVFKARHFYLEKEAEKCLDNNLEVFEPQTFNEFMDCYIKGRVGNVHRASVLRIELEDAVRRYYFVSAHARLLHLFWEAIHEANEDEADYADNYNRSPDTISPNVDALDASSCLRRQSYERNFLGGRVRESMIPQRKLNYMNQCSAFLLNLRQICGTVCVDRRVVIPDAMRKRAETHLIQKGFGKEVFTTEGTDKRPISSTSRHNHGSLKVGGATFDPLNPFGLPKYYDAKVIQFPTHKAFFSNAIFNLLGDYEGLTTRIVKKLEKADIWTPGKSTPTRASCDIIEAEIYTVLEAALNIFEHMLVAINGSEDTLRGEDDLEAGPPSPDFPPGIIDNKDGGSRSDSTSSVRPSRSDSSNSLVQHIIEPSNLSRPRSGLPPSYQKEVRQQPKIIDPEPATAEDITNVFIQLQGAISSQPQQEAQGEPEIDVTSEAVYSILAGLTTEEHASPAYDFEASNPSHGYTHDNVRAVNSLPLGSMF